MNANDKDSKRGMPLSSSSFFEIIDLPDEGRSGVMKVVNPSGWNVVEHDLAEYEGQLVHIRFAVDIKRVGTTGALQWQINTQGYPLVGRAVSKAKADVWHSMSGEWTGVVASGSDSTSRVFYLSTWKNDSQATTYYIDKFNVEVASMGKWVKRAPMEPKKLGDVAKYIKTLIPANIPEDFKVKPRLRDVADEETVRKSVPMFRDFLYRLCDQLMQDDIPNNKPSQEKDAVNLSTEYPFLNNLKSILFNLGSYGEQVHRGQLGDHGTLSSHGEQVDRMTLASHGEQVSRGTSLMVSDWESLTTAMSADGGKLKSKISTPNLIKCLRFLTSCGMDFDGIDLDAKKPDMSKVGALTASYPDEPMMPTGLKVMAFAQNEWMAKGNDDVFLRCDYRVMGEETTDVASILKEILRSLPQKVQDLALHLHQHCLDSGLKCNVTTSSLRTRFNYTFKNKEIWMLAVSLNYGCRIHIRAENVHQYADVVEKFPAMLRDNIAMGYGCDKKRFGEPCQSGCHGFRFPFDESFLDMGRDVEIWIDTEIACLTRRTP